MRKSANVEKGRRHVARAVSRASLNRVEDGYRSRPTSAPRRVPNHHSPSQFSQNVILEHQPFSAQDQAAIRVAISLIQGKWKIGILCRLHEGPARLGDLRRLFPQASKKMLTQHLRQMEQNGIITRTDLSGKVPRVEYSLSNSLGRSVMDLIDLLVQWGEQHWMSSDVRHYPEIDPPARAIHDQSN
ncbi:MAG: winged helix-turn-helix transcriptional regulator [Bryobacteraceae bacterium]